MAAKIKFDPESAFKSIIGPDQKEEKGKPKEADHETKKRICLMVYPSIYADLQKIAYVDRVSITDVVNSLIKDYVASHIEKLKEYDQLKQS